MSPWLALLLLFATPVVLYGLLLLWEKFYSDLWGDD